MPYQPKYEENEFDSRIERFDASWQTGAIPDIRDYLHAEEGEPLVERKPELITELVMIDLEYRWRRPKKQSSILADSAESCAGPQHPIPERPLVEDYIVPFPELRQGKLTKVISSEYHARHRWGDCPNHDEYLRRFPEHARVLSETLPGVDQRLPRAARGDQLKIRCPHCHAPMDSTAHDLSGEIECRSCHCAFSLIDEPSSRRIAAGRKLGSFQLIEPLGSGSFGTVWKARDMKLDRDVAIKIPHREQLQPQQVEQFLREARTAAQLNHPNIVSVHEVGRDAETVFVISDLIDGTTLSDWLKGRRLSAREAAEMCQTIARALDHAHHAGVIHRDLKPSNIIMDSDGQPHLTDFGLARREAGEVTMTRDGQLLGTPAYMSPEQARGEAHGADQRSDIYSVGVILYELLTGVQPFRGSIQMLLRQIVDEDVESPRRLNSSVPRDLATICLKCLEKERANRFPTAVEFSDELQRFLEGRPITARPISIPTRFWRWSKRKPAAALAIALLLFIATAAPLVAINQWRAAEHYRWKQYASDMKVAMDAWESANVHRVQALLDQHVPKRGQKDLRGFEWYYLWRLCRPMETTTLPFRAPAWVAFSPDGNTLAATGRGVLHLWDLEAGRELQTLAAHNGLAPGLAFSPDGQILATTGLDGKLGLWQLSDNRELVLLQQIDSGGFDVAFSPDGRFLATDGPRHDVQLWDVETRILVRRFRGHNSSVRHLAFSASGHLASAGADGHVVLRDVETGEPFELGGHGTGVTPVTFSPDSATLVSGGEDDLIRLWDVAHRQLKTIVRGHSNSVTSLSYSPDGKMLASGSRDGTVKLWDMHTQEEIATIRGHGGVVLDVVFCPDGQTLASAGLDHNVKLWSVAAATKKEPFEGKRVAFAGRDGTLSTWTSSGVLKTWDLATGQLKHELASPEGDCVAARSPDGNLVAVGHRDGTLEIRDVASGEGRTVTERPAESIDSLQFSPDGKYLASLETRTRQSRRLTLWDLSTFEGLAELDFYESSEPAFSPDWTMIATCSRTPDAEVYAVKLWDRAGKELATIPQLDPVFALAFSDDGGMLAAGSWNGEIQLWDVSKREQLFPPLKGHTGIVYSLAFSPDSHRLASSSRDRTVKLWDLATGDEMITLKGHRRRVRSVDFSTDGRTLASASDDNVVRLWRTASIEEVRRSDR